MIKTILKQLGLFLLQQGAKLAFKFADKDGNGELSKEEIAQLVKQIRNLAKNYKK